MQGFTTVGWRDLYNNQAICTAGVVVRLRQHHDVKLRYSVGADVVLGYHTALYVQLVAAAVVFSARNAPLIRMLPSMREHWCAVLGLNQLIGTRRYVHPRDRVDGSWMPRQPERGHRLSAEARRRRQWLGTTNAAARCFPRMGRKTVTAGEFDRQARGPPDQAAPES